MPRSPYDHDDSRVNKQFGGSLFGLSNPTSLPLTQEEALDVAGYIHEQPRPKFVPTHPDKIERLIPLTEGK